MKKTGIVVLSLVLYLVPFKNGPEAQTVLTIEDAIEIALEKGDAAKRLALTRIQAENSYANSKLGLFPQVSMNMNLPDWRESVQAIQEPNKLPEFNSTGSKTFSGDFRVVNRLITDGQVTFRSNINHLGQTTYIATGDTTLRRNDMRTGYRVEFSQPLFTYNRTRANLRNAGLAYERSKLAYARDELNIVFNVSNAFYNLYRSIRAVEIAREAVQQRQNAADLAKLKFDAGLVSESVALQTEVDLSTAQTGLFNAENRLESEMDSFKHLIGIGLNQEIMITTDMAYTTFDIDLERAIDEGLANSLVLQDRNISIEQARESVRQADARSEVRADLTAYYDFTGVSDTSMPYGTGTRTLFDSSWDDLNRRPANRGISFSVSIPIWDWGVNKREVQNAEATLRNRQIDLQSELINVRNNIRNAAREVISSEKNLENTQKAQAIAERSYSISLERFSIGQIDSNALAQDASRLENAKTAYLNAYIAYQSAVLRLKQETLWDFENNRSIRK